MYSHSAAKKVAAVEIVSKQSKFNLDIDVISTLKNEIKEREDEVSQLKVEMEKEMSIARNLKVKLDELISNQQLQKSDDPQAQTLELNLQISNFNQETDKCDERILKLEQRLKDTKHFIAVQRQKNRYNI